LKAIKSLAEKGVSKEEMAREVQKTSKLGKGLIEYIAKTEVAA